MVAESIVIFGAHRPVRMLERLLAAVAARIASRVQVRNGPPEAVRIDAARRPRAGRRSAPGTSRCARNRPATRWRRRRPRVRMNRAPAQTRHSLLASATVAPRSSGGERGLQPGRAADRRHHPIGRPLRRLRPRAASPAAASMPLPDKRVLQLAIGRRGRRRRQSGRRARARAVPAAAALRFAVTASTR